MSKAWKGRLPGGTDSRVEQFTESISFDQRLYRHDIKGSIAHATMLESVGLISTAERDQIISTLGEIGGQIDEGVFPFSISQEDIHGHIEQALIAKLGDVGRKLHSARSRNDQIATDVRLWIREQIDELDGMLADLQRALLEMGKRHRDVILPAYTHLQRAQPVLAPHYLLAYVEKFDRDRGRLADARRRVNVLPLGSAAVAGTSLPIDRQRVADLLGFDAVADNSIDATSDRDFIIETVFVVVLIAEHLSAWADEWILWCTTEFDFLTLPDAFCTGSSIMPHKKNPDVLELIRGKTARVIGDLQTLLVLIKGLPLAYHRDLQEDKPPLFDAIDTVRGCVELATAMVHEARFKPDSIARRLEEGFLDATTFMEQLIAFGVPMRSAHEAVGAMVRRSIESGCRLGDLPESEFDRLVPGRGPALRSTLGVAQTLLAFRSYGSTAPAEVDRQLQRWTDKLS